MKRGYVGVYHKMSPKHLDRYVAEFERRHNVRDDDTLAQMGETVEGMGRKRLRWCRGNPPAVPGDDYVPK